MFGGITKREQALEDYEEAGRVINQLYERKKRAKLAEEHYEINNLLSQLAIKRALLKKVIFNS